jgi:hypothetical protein
MGADPGSVARRSGAPRQIAIVGCGSPACSPPRLSAGHYQREAPEILWTHLEEGIDIALDLAGDRMWVTDLAGSIYLANLDGAGHKQILAAQGNLTGIAYTELPAGS